MYKQKNQHWLTDYICKCTFKLKVRYSSNIWSIFTGKKCILSSQYFHLNSQFGCKNINNARIFRILGNLIEVNSKKKNSISGAYSNLLLKITTSTFDVLMRRNKVSCVGISIDVVPLSPPSLEPRWHLSLCAYPTTSYTCIKCARRTPLKAQHFVMQT